MTSPFPISSPSKDTLSEYQFPLNPGIERLLDPDAPSRDATSLIVFNVYVCSLKCISYTYAKSFPTHLCSQIDGYVQLLVAACLLINPIPRYIHESKKELYSVRVRSREKERVGSLDIGIREIAIGNLLLRASQCLSND